MKGLTVKQKADSEFRRRARLKKRVRPCRKCGGEGKICSQSGRPWSKCDCGWCERGPSTVERCPKCKAK